MAQEKKRLIQQINEAVKNDPFDAEDERQVEFMKMQQRKLMEGEW